MNSKKKKKKKIHELGTGIEKATGSVDNLDNKTRIWTGLEYLRLWYYINKVN